VDMATWDGSAFAYTIHHFSPEDVNPNAFGEWVTIVSQGQDPNHSDTICGGSALNVAGGSVRQRVALPTYSPSGRGYAATANYDSGLAGSRALGPAPVSGTQAVPTSALAVSVRGTTVNKMCVPQGAAAQLAASSPGSCAGGSCSLGGVLAAPWASSLSLWGNSL